MSPAPPSRIGLYLHIPFCAKKCPYCDFNTYAGLEDLYDAYTAALCTEIERRAAQVQDRTIDTIFIGGGTPTVLPAGAIARLLDVSRRVLDIAPGAEISCEANPGTVDVARFAELRDAGVNRLSMGVQSMQPAELRFLERIHDAEDVPRAVAAARAAGFERLSLDLMFGLPDQSTEAWASSLEAALDLAPEHLSLYSLIVEPGTPLHQWVREGRVAAPDDDRAAEQYELAQDRMARAGWVHYEISNWARPCPAAPAGRAEPRSHGQGRDGQGSHVQAEHGQDEHGQARHAQDGASAITSDASRSRRGDQPQAAARTGQDNASKEASPTSDRPPTEQRALACRHNLRYWRNGDWLACGPGAHGQLRSHGEEGMALRRYSNVRPVPGYLRRLREGASLAASDELVPEETARGETMMLGLRLIQEGVTRHRFQKLHGADPEQVFAAVVAELRAWGLLAVDGTRLRLTPRGVLVGNHVVERFLAA